MANIVFNQITDERKFTAIAKGKYSNTDLTNLAVCVKKIKILQDRVD